MSNGSIDRTHTVVVPDVIVILKRRLIAGPRLFVVLVSLGGALLLTAASGADVACSIVGPAVVCVNSSANAFFAPPGMAGYKWSISGNGNFAGAANGSNVAVNAAAAGNFTLSLRFTNNAAGVSNCSRVISVSTVTATVMGSATICSGASTLIQATLTGPSPWTLAWSDGFVQTNITTNIATRFVAPTNTTVYAVTNVLGGNCQGAASGNAAITVNTRPSVTLNPTNRIVCAGTNVTFSSMAIGNPAPAVRWQVSTNGGMTWTNLWPIVVATQANYSFTATAADDGKYYRAKFTNDCGVVTNTPVLLRVSTTATPLTNQSICPGNTVTFATTASGFGPFTFQWRQGTTPIPGATNGALTLANVTSANTGVYSVIVSGPCNSITNSATLTVSTTVSATPLTNLFRFDGGIAIFNGVGLTAGPFTYQWSKEGNPLPNQTNSSLVLSNLAIEESGTYSVVVSSGCGSVTNGATLLVAPCHPSLDVMLVIDRSGGMSGQPYLNARTACTNFIRGLHLNPNGDTIGLVSYNPTPTLNQTLTNSRVVLEQSVNALGPATNGTCVGCAIDMAQEELVSNRHRSSGLSVLILLSDGLPHDFDTPSNALYYATKAKNAGTRVFTVGFGEVDPALMASMASAPNDFFYATNSSQLSVLFEAIAAEICRGATNFFGPSNVTVCDGATVNFNVTATGCSLFTYQWRKDGNPLLNATNSSLAITDVSVNDAGVYSVVVTGDCQTATNSATLVVNQPPVVAPLASLTRCVGDSASFETIPGATGLFTFVWRKDGVVLSGQTNAALVFPSVARPDAGIYSVEVNGMCGSVTNVATLTVNELATATPLDNATLCAGDSALFVTSVEGTGPFGFVWKKDGVAIDGERNAILMLPNVSAAKAGTYVVEVTGACNSVTNSAVLVVRELTTATPFSDAIRCVGKSVTFDTTPTGTGPFTFVWRKDGLVLLSQTNRSLSIGSVTTNDSGIYTLAIEGACNRVTNSARLTVNELTTATPLANVTLCAGDSTSFATTVQGTGPFAFVWKKDGVVIELATNASFTISNASVASAGAYAVEVTGACNSVTNSAVLTVRDLTTASPFSDATRCVGDSVMFDATPSGTGPFTFVWRKDGLVLPSQTNSSLSIASVTTNGAGIYTLEIEGACNRITNVARLTVNELTIATPLDNATLCAGDWALFVMSVQGTGPFEFVWKKDGVVIDWAHNAILTLPNVSAADAGTYVVEVAGACNSVTNSAVLVVRELTIASPFSDATRCVGDGITFDTVPSGTGPFTFVWRKDGLVLPSQTNGSLSIVSVTTNDAGIYTLEIEGACNRVTNSARLTVNELTTATPLANVTLCAGDSTSFATTVQGTGPFAFVWRKDGVAMGGQTNATLVIVAAANESAGVYSVEVSGACNSVTNSAALSVRELTRTTAFSDATRCVGDSVIFGTTPSGTGPFTFVWRQKGVVLPSQTNGSLSIVSVTTNDAGIYTLEIEGACNRVTNAATLTVNELATATPLDDATLCAGDWVLFVTSVQGTGPFGFVWKKDGVVMDGAHNAILILPNVSAADAGTYVVEVTGTCNSVTNSAVLVVREWTTATPFSDATRCAGESVIFGTTPNGTGPFGFHWTKDGVVIALATNATLTIPNISVTSAGTYAVEVTGACNAVTNSAVLSVRELTTTAPFSDATRCVGESVMFDVTPSGTGPFTFVWRKDGLMLPLQTNVSLSIARATTNDAGIYTLEIEGACNRVTNSARLTVNELTVATPLANVTLCAGDSTLLATTVQGTGPFAFVWKKDGVVIALATNAILTIPNVSVASAGTYAVEVTGACNLVTNSAVLVVRELTTATPFSDATRCVGDSVMFGTTPSGTGPFTFVWRKDGLMLPSQTNGSLSIVNVTTNDAGIYTLEIEGACNTVTNSARLTVNELTTATPLANATLCVGGSVSFATTVQGTGPFAFVWRKDGVAMGGQTNATLVIVAATNESAGVYSVEVSGACNSVTNSAALSVRELTSTTAFFDAARCVGESITFDTTPIGTGPFTYAWRKDGLVLPSPTNSSLSIVSVTTNDAGIYTLEIEGACNRVTNSARLTVNELTTATPLANVTVCAGDSTSFATTVQGTGPFAFVWKKDGVVIALATNAILTIPNLSVASAGTYAVEVTGACNAVTNSALLTVRELTTAPPFSDATRCVGDSITFDITPSGTGPFTFIWRKGGLVLPSQTNSSLSTVSVTTNDAGIYTLEIEGACNGVTNSARLTVNELTTATPLASFAVCPGDPALFSTLARGTGPFTFVWRRDGVAIDGATNDTLMIVSATNESAGAYSVEVSGACNSVTNVATLSINSPTIASALANQTRCGTAIFETIANGTGPFAYMWRKDGILLANETNSSLVLTNVRDLTAGVYSVEVHGLCNIVTNSAQLFVSADVTATPLSDATRCLGDSATFLTVGQGTGPLLFVWRKDGVVLGGETNSMLTISSVAPASAGTYSVEVSGACNSVTNSAVLSIYAPTTATAPVDTVRCLGETATFATVPSGRGPFTFAWRRTGLLLANQTNSTLSVPVTSTNDAGVYAVEVSGLCNSVTNSATLSANELTTAGAMPSQVVCPGASATFVSASGGTGPFVYLWRKDGVPVPGATNHFLQLTNVLSAEAGVYSVEITGACNAATNSATLTVLAGSSATPLMSQTYCAGDTGVFSTTASGAGPLTFAWRKNGTLLTNETNSELVLGNLQTTDAGTYSVEVTGACGSVTNSAILTVLARTFASPLANQSVCAGASATLATIASGAEPFTCVWRKDGVAMAGQTNSSISITNVSVADAGIYTVEISGACGSVTNSATLATIVAVTGPTNVSVCSGQAAVFNAHVIEGGNGNYAWRHNGALLPGETNTTLIVTDVTPGKTGIYSFEATTICGNITTSATLSINTDVTVSAMPDQVQCEGRSVTFAPVVIGTGPLRFLWKKDGVAIPNATNSSFTISSVVRSNAGVYAVEITGPCNTVGTSATLTLNATPLKDLTVCAGQSATFSTIAAIGPWPVTYVWRKNGNVIPGRTNSLLIITNAVVTDSGTYSVEVIGCSRVTNSSLLTVRALLSATMPTNTVACSCSDLVIGPVVTGTGPFQYVWKKDGTALQAQTNIALNLGKPNTVRPGVFTVEITGPCNSVTNRTAVSLINVTNGQWMNSNLVLIPEFGTAGPYPSRIFVQCGPSPITELRVTLRGLSHTFPDDLDILLVGPDGTAVTLMSDAGGMRGNFVTGIDLTFDDKATDIMPDSSFILPGSYKPADYVGDDTVDSYPAPAPPGANATQLSAFYGSNPNGSWSLYIVDDHGRDSGSLTNGWVLDFGNGAFMYPAPSLTDPVKIENGSFQMKLNGEPNKIYFIEASTDLQHWDTIQTNVLYGTSATIIDTSAPQFNYRFYRASGCRN